MLLDIVPPDMSLYLFGSAVDSNAAEPSDVDLLLVYRDGRHDWAHAVACALRETAAFPPLDVLAMSQSEAAETNFVAAEGAVMVGSGSAHP
jgi:predicted nucleotidyltransferase